MASSSSPHYKGDGNCISEDGKGGWVINANALDVTWGSDNRYWKVPSGSKDPLELKQVAWLEVTCSIPITKLTKLKTKTIYEVKFWVSVKQETAFGWNGCPVYLMVRVNNKKPTWVSADLSTITKKGEKQTIPNGNKLLTFEMSDEDAKETNANVSLGLYEIWKGRWKGGLLIHQVNITSTTK